MVSAVREYVRQHWDLLPAPEEAPARLTCAVEAVGVSKGCVFVFAEPQTEPVCVVKIARTPHCNPILEHEYSALAQVRDCVSGHLADTLPCPLHTGWLDGHFVALETFLPGRTMTAIISGSGAKSVAPAGRCLRLGAQWLAALHRQSARTRPPLSGRNADGCAVDLIEDLARNCTWSQRELSFLSRLQELGRGLGSASVPLVFSHGDFEPGNLLLNGDQLIVTDWQFAEADGLPLLDLLNLVLRYCFMADGLEGISDEWIAYREAFRKTLLSESWLTIAAAPVIREYLEALRLEVSVPFFLALTLATNAVKFLGFLADRADRGYVYMMRTAGEADRPFEERLRDQLYVRLLRELARPGAFEALQVLEAD